MEINYAFILNSVMKGVGHFAIIWNLQTCEELFRTLRSLTSSGLTEINFSILEALEMINRVKLIQNIAFDLRDEFQLTENITSNTSELMRYESAFSGYRMPQLLLICKFKFMLNLV